jgi:DNA-binding NarL/FixJ family response regulator
MTPTILLADDHIMISKGLRKLFEIDFGYRDVESVTSCNGVLKLLKKRRHTHLVIDIGLIDGSALEIFGTIRNLYPDTRIMVYSAKPSVVYERALEQFGIFNYLSKETDELETIRRFRQFLAGREEDLPRGGASRDGALKESPFSSLTSRQLEILHYLLHGRSGIEIAEALNVTQSTVSTIKGQVFERTGTKNLMELTTLAGLYSLT